MRPQPGVRPRQQEDNCVALTPGGQPDVPQDLVIREERAGLKQFSSHNSRQHGPIDLGQFRAVAGIVRRLPELLLGQFDLAVGPHAGGGEPAHVGVRPLPGVGDVLEFPARAISGEPHRLQQHLSHPRFEERKEQVQGEGL